MPKVLKGLTHSGSSDALTHAALAGLCASPCFPGDRGARVAHAAVLEDQRPTSQNFVTEPGNSQDTYDRGWRPFRNKNQVFSISESRKGQTLWVSKIYLTPLCLYSSSRFIKHFQIISWLTFEVWGQYFQWLWEPEPTAGTSFGHRRRLARWLQLVQMRKWNFREGSSLFWDPISWSCGHNGGGGAKHDFCYY